VVVAVLRCGPTGKSRTSLSIGGAAQLGMNDAHPRLTGNGLATCKAPAQGRPRRGSVLGAEPAFRSAGPSRALRGYAWRARPPMAGEAGGTCLIGKRGSHAEGEDPFVPARSAIGSHRRGGPIRNRMARADSQRLAHAKISLGANAPASLLLAGE
jgi:hypothetical protein